MSETLKFTRNEELLKTAPIVFSSSHGVYEITEDMEPFVIPPNMYILETQEIGDYCLTGIDEMLWWLIQGTNRKNFIKFLRGETITDGTGKNVTEQTRAIVKDCVVYEPGATLYSRHLSIGGGRGARESYANMGFYKFPIGMPHQAWPRGTSAVQVLEPLRTELIADAYESLTYEDFIERLRDEEVLEADEPCILIFSCCAEPRRGDGISTETYNAGIAAVGAVQDVQRLKLINENRYARGGPGNSSAAPAPTMRRATTARPSRLPPSSFYKSKPYKPEYRSLADKGWASRTAPRNWKDEERPAGTIPLFIRRGNSWKQLRTRKGSFWFSELNSLYAAKKGLRNAKRQTRKGERLRPPQFATMEKGRIVEFDTVKDMLGYLKKGQ